MEPEKQHVRIKAILEILGKPKDFVESRMKEYISKIKEDENLMVMEEKISEPKKEGELFTIFAEVEMVIKGFSNLVGFCIDYMPSSIEIIKPDEFYFGQRTFTNFINDTLAKLHNVDMIAKKMGTENRFLKKNINNLIMNSLLVLVRLNINKADILAKAMGMEEEETKRLLDILKKENKITEEKGVYSVAKNG
ncbi:hypothetical protein GF323_06420 [Candidatus Woesearchaeota archaeon]|nr:hypothetical protein [Candidatus Woesearchaeota archaeon]